MSEKNKLVRGYGVNDYNGKVKNNPLYTAWANMLERCYSDKFHKKNLTYIGCTVCKNWLSLSNFKKWYDVNYVEGCHLDKDIIKRGNKIYSPKYCRYVSPQLNMLLTDCSAKRGNLPQGVYLGKGKEVDSYKARVAYNGKQTYIGCFPVIKSAFMAYANAKHKIIIDAARKQMDIEVREGLVNHAKALLNEADAYI